MRNVRNSINLLVALFILFSSGYWLGKVKNYPVLAELSLDLAGVALGIVATTWLIDRIVSENALRERDRMRRTAYEHLKKVLQNHLHFLQSAYKASRSSPPSSLPETVGDLLGRDFLDALQRLDFDKSAPVTPGRTWAIHMAEECSNFSRSIHSAIDRYVIVLESNEVKQLERVADSGLVSFAKLLPTIQAENRAIGRGLGNVFRNGSCLLAEHVEFFLVVVGTANSLISPLDRIEPNRNLWADSMSPAFGDSVSDVEG